MAQNLPQYSQLTRTSKMTDRWRAVVTPRANPDGDGPDKSSGLEVSVPDDNLLVESENSDVVVVHHDPPGSSGLPPCEYTLRTHVLYATEESTMLEKSRETKAK